jgi:predicted kinase
MDAVILIGVPGAGKSTFYEQRFASTHVRLNLDELKSRAAEIRLLHECIERRRPFVVDDTNVRKVDRAPFVAAAREAGYRVIAYFFQLSMRAAIKRNSLRSGKQVIPVPALIRSWKRVEPPALEEGFDEIRMLEVQADGSAVESLPASEP